MEHWLAEQGLTREQLQRRANQNQAADQVSIGHSIGSLRYLNAMDWRQFVETMSIVEETLRTDPAGIYASMDFVTRDRYRHRVEGLSRHSKLNEKEVAEMAIRLATEAAGRGGLESGNGGVVESSDRRSHVGYYLIDKGQSRLEKAVKVLFSLRRFVARTALRIPILCYVGAILLTTTGTMVLMKSS